MGVFDTVDVKKTVILNNNLPPILPLRYQTKDLDCYLKVYTLEEVLRDFKLREITLYNVFSEDCFSYLLDNEDLEKNILFSINHFSECIANRWIEYHLKISRKKITDIKLFYSR